MHSGKINCNKVPQENVNSWWKDLKHLSSKRYEANVKESSKEELLMRDYHSQLHIMCVQCSSHGDVDEASIMLFSLTQFIVVRTEFMHPLSVRNKVSFHTSQHLPTLSVQQTNLYNKKITSAVSHPFN